jgi:hypothetical protein
MAEQRQVSPIPPGRYWITVLGRDNMADFDAWIRDMHGAVQIEAASLDQQANPPVQFVIFRVPAGRMPFLNAHQFGFPSFAPPNVTSIQDVEQSPVVPGTLDRLEQVASKAGEVASEAVLLVLAFLLLSRH